MDALVYFWRHVDTEGLERLELSRMSDRIVAASTTIAMDSGGYRLDHRWNLDTDWSVRSVDIERRGSSDHGTLHLHRHGNGWQVDGQPRPDLDGALEPDLSITPFCNTFPIRRMSAESTASLQLDTAFIDGTTLTVSRSRQRYDRMGPRKFRYRDLGLFSGFDADIVVDESDLVLSYWPLGDCGLSCTPGGENWSWRSGEAPYLRGSAGSAWGIG